MYSLLKKDIKELFSSKKRISILIILLIVLVISIYLNVTNEGNKNSVSKIEFGVVDQDNSSYSKLLLDYFKESESFSSYINIVQGQEDNIQKEFKEGKLDVYLEIPENFAENMVYLKHLPVKVLINTADTTKALLLKNILESYEKYISAVEINCVALYDIMQQAGMDDNLIEDKNIEISYDLIFTALGKETFFNYQETGNFPATSILNYYMCAIVSIIIIYSGLFVGFLMMKEKRQGTLQRLRTVGIRVSSILFEKIIVSSGVIFIIIYFLYIITSLLKGEVLDFKIVILYLCAVLFCVTFTILLSGLFEKISNFMIISNFICFIFILIGGGIIPIKYLPLNLVILAKFTPNYWFIKLLLLIQKGISGEVFVKYILFIILGAVLFYILSIIVYSREKVPLDE